LENEDCFEKFRDRIVLVNNPKYEEYGSGYSLYKGLEESLKYDFDEIIFAEGDLYIDRESCEKVFKASKSVITVNPEPILANTAVAMYKGLNDKIHYIYDTKHVALEVPEPFTAIYNSGQVWKFADKEAIKRTFLSLDDLQWQGTNLVYVEKYYNSIKTGDYYIIPFMDWINCNTIIDYRKITELEESNEDNE
jgi:hypothetical protein